MTTPTSPVRTDELRDRRRLDRRTNVALAELSLPELRRIVLTWLLAALVVALFVWMVRDVLIAGILGVVIAAYLRPFYLRLHARTRGRTSAAFLTLAIVILPVLGALAYSYSEILDVVKYLAGHQEEVAARIAASLRRVVFFERVSDAQVRAGVLRAARYGASIPGMLQRAVAGFSVAATIFLFTAFYIFTQGEEVMAYLRSKIPPRYAELTGALNTNVRGVLYGAIYSTLLTQTLKSVIIFVLCLVFRVPLAGVLAILSFIIGFFPIVGSWSVYVPVALWLMVFRNAVVPAVVILVVGFGLNTVFISTYLRPKIAADRSRVLNFYWMFLGLVTGVYTFGLAGILLGPILIGLLKAVVDTVTAGSSWRLLEAEGDGDALAPGTGSGVGDGTAGRIAG